LAFVESLPSLSVAAVLPRCLRYGFLACHDF
jgi:hypothetical protein